MRNRIGVLATATLLWSCPGFAQTLPEWLQDVNPATGQSDSDSSTSKPAPRTDVTTDSTPSEETGPLLEEYGVKPYGAQPYVEPSGEPAGEPYDAETVDERSARQSVDEGVATLETPGPAVDATYGVQPSDVLQISVWREPELQREVTVSPDGRINYPLIGSLHVEGKSVEEIGKEIETGLTTRFMKQAAVTVTIKEVLGNRIYVIGQVNRPGAFAFTKSLDVMQALSLAGGAAKYAELDDIKILRRVGGVPKAFEFNYSQVQHGHKLDQNILLENGDVIMVP